MVGKILNTIWAIMLCLILLFGQTHIFGRVFTGPFYAEPAQQSVSLPTLRKI